MPYQTAEMLASRVNGPVNGVRPQAIHGETTTAFPHEDVKFDESLKPKSYSIKGTDPESRILFRNVNILDSTGRDPFVGDIYIEGKQALEENQMSIC